MAHDTDVPNRWDALQTVATASLRQWLRMPKRRLRGFRFGLGAIVDDRLDGSSKAMLDLPSDGDLGRAMDVVAVDDITARASAMATLATTHRDVDRGGLRGSRKHALEFNLCGTWQPRTTVAWRMCCCGI